jgi:hypothetical protein
MDRVTFGISMDIFRNEYLPDDRDWGWDANISYMPADWRTTTQSIPSYNRSHLAIKTGKLSNITVVDISTMNAPDEIRQIVPSYTKDIYHVSSPNYSKQYYFEYEPELHSVASTRPGVTVLNDDRFTIASGREYSPWDNVPITKMPREMLALLLRWQKERDIIAHESTLTLLSILPNTWITDDENFICLTEALLFYLGTGGTAVTLRQLSNNKIGYVDERRLRIFIDCRLSSMQCKTIIKEAVAKETPFDERRLRLLVDTSKRPFTLTALKKVIKEHDPVAFKEWENSKRRKQPTVKTVREGPFKFIQGGCVKLSELKEVLPSITAPKLLKMNPEWTTVLKKICNHCDRYHNKRCCSEYRRDASHTCRFIQNIKIDTWSYT